MPPTQTTRTKHIGYDVGPSRKIPDGALARVATAECRKANKSNALMRFALALFSLLRFRFGTVKAALKAAAALTTRPTDRGGAPPAFQLQVKVDGATVMLDAGSAWTAAEVKAALHAKTGRASGGYYLVARGGKPLDDGAPTTLAVLGVGPGDRLELRGRLRGGMGCGASKGPAGPASGAWKMVEPGAAAGAAERAEAEATAATASVVQAAGESPPLPAQQQAEPAKEAELAAPPELTPSYWDEVGEGKPNASALKRALADTVLVDAAWLARLADAGDILPRCQDLPEGARVTLEEMEQWTEGWTVGVLVISYPWLDADHPDKDGLQLRAISHVLKIFDKEAKEYYGAGCKVGVFLDYVSMPQRSRGSAEDDRTPEEKATFDKALKAINRWYAHPKTHVLLVDTELPAGAHTNMQPYAGRGWCVMERNASGLVKDDSCLISLKGLTGEETFLSEVRENGKAARAPPVAPAPFASTLEADVASGATTFTNKGDVPVVAKIYGWAFAAEMEAVVALSYSELGWDDAQMLALCEALRAAHAGGGLRKVETLHLGRNQMGDGAAAALAALLEEGAMPNLEGLYLNKNQIADDGVAALASALRGGALPSCTKIVLSNNQIGDDGVAALASALRGGALPAYTYIELGGNPGSRAPVEEALASPERMAAVTQNASHMAAVVELYYVGLRWDDAQVLALCEALRAAHAGGGLRKVETLNLCDNQMGDGAAAALAALLEEGAMPNLKALSLNDNQIGDDGVAALASALRGGALPACTKIDLRGNQIGDDGVAALASALRGGALPACTKIDLGRNQIGDDGVAALASALRGGALPACEEIDLYGNPGSDAKDDDDVDSKVKEALASPERAAAVTQDASYMAAVVELDYGGLGWDDAQMLTLCAALRAAHAGGGLRKLEELDLRSNQMGDGAAAALAALLEEGAMPNLKVLDLRGNQIGDDGVAALASALRGGALPSCTKISLADNQIGDDGVAALASALRGGALPACEYSSSCTEILIGSNPGSGAPVDEALESPERAAALAQRQAE